MRPQDRADIAIKRVYEPPAPVDGARILVDRLWPRGLAKDTAHIDRQLRDLAPSAALRRWFGHDPGRGDEFRRRYGEELAGCGTQLEQLCRLAQGRRLTLLFAAHDAIHNNAAALREILLTAV